MIGREHIPLAKSLEETVDLWPTLTAKQKLGATAASLITAAGPITRQIVESNHRPESSHLLAYNLAHVIVDIRDGLDGKLARATGGVTPFGKELDPFADKVDFFIQELAQSRRGDLPPSHTAIRLIRDIAVTALRSHVMVLSDGKADVGAKLIGKASTVMRQASLRTTTLSLDHGRPNLRRAHQSTATAGIVVSGAVNVKKLLDERAKFI